MHKEKMQSTEMRTTEPTPIGRRRRAPKGDDAAEPVTPEDFARLEAEARAHFGRTKRGAK